MADDADIAIQVLRNAVEMEIEGRSFFRRASEVVRNQRAKDTFVSLVKQEQRHVDILGEELNRLEKGLSWASLQQMKLEAPTYPKISVFQDKDVRHMKLDPDAGELDVLKIGMEIEKRSIDYYRNASFQTADQKAKEVFTWLVGEEAGHLTILSAEHDYRTRSGYYYDNSEFSLETF
jgi:rubrerythrin